MDPSTHETSSCSLAHSRTLPQSARSTILHTGSSTSVVGSVVVGLITGTLISPLTNPPAERSFDNSSYLSIDFGPTEWHPGTYYRYTDQMMKEEISKVFWRMWNQYGD
jgi:hypothetical protein